MKTISFFFFLSAVLFTTALQGQAAINPGIQSSFDAYIQYSNNKEWDKAFDLLYPKLFTKVAKQDLVDVMLGMEADGMELQLRNTKITSTSVPVVEGDETFVRVEYVSDMVVSIVTDGKYDAPKSIQAIEEQFTHIYGDGNVKWDVTNKQYKIIAHKAMIAVKTVSDEWKLVEVNMDQPELMQSLFSPAVMDALVSIK